MSTTLLKQQVEALIPHRGNALFVKTAWVDDIPADVQESTGVSGGCEIYWDDTDPFIQGHFPGFHVVPGVFLVEALAQLAGVLLTHRGRQLNEGAEQIGLLTGIRKTLFHRPVRPRDVVQFLVKVNRMGERFFLAHGTAFVEDQKVATLEIMIGSMDRKSLFHTEKDKQ